MTRILMALLLAAIAALPALARAGSDAAGAPILPAAQVATFAERVERDLAERGAQVAIVARMGRDGDLREGIRYTHVAFWVHSDITDASGAAGAAIAPGTSANPPTATPAAAWCKTARPISSPARTDWTRA
jgi:hypothetical protein